MQDLRELTAPELSAVRKDYEAIQHNKFWQRYVETIQYEYLRALTLPASLVPKGIEDIWKIALFQGSARELKRVLSLPDEVCQPKRILDT